MGRDSLGEFEQLVMLACLRLGRDAYTVPIIEELEKRAGRSVSHAKREIGIRMALGAGRARVYRDVVGRMLFVVLLGVGLGLPLAVTGGRVAAGLLYGVSPTDLVALSAACAMLVLVTLVAAWAPARRAARIDPLEVIRAE